MKTIPESLPSTSSLKFVSVSSKTLFNGAASSLDEEYSEEDDDAKAECEPTVITRKKTQRR